MSKIKCSVIMSRELQNIDNILGNDCAPEKKDAIISYVSALLSGQWAYFVNGEVLALADLDESTQSINVSHFFFFFFLFFCFFFVFIYFYFYFIFNCQNASNAGKETHIQNNTHTKQQHTKPHTYKKPNNRAMEGGLFQRKEEKNGNACVKEVA